MQVRLLGPVDVVVDGGPRPVRGLRRGAVLAVLAMHCGEVVSTGRLVDIVWGETAPPTVVNTLQAHVSYLRGILGSKAAIRADALGDTGRGYAGRIEAASEHMAALIDDILNLATAARAPITIQPVDLGALAAAITADLQRQDPARRARLTIAQPATALADPVLIRTVLQNLLDNAWKFTSRTASADIEFGTTPSADPARTAFYVRDNGAGFDPAYKDRLFQPFQRLHTTTEFPGTGIGLATVRQIIRRHHGDTYADSTPGHGTTITFTLPAAPP